MPTWIQIGEHRCYVEGNLFVMELRGPVAYSEIAGLLAPQDELLQRFPSILTLCDARQTELPNPEVRKFLAERGKQFGGRKISSVVITNSLLLRTAVQLVEHASRLLTGRPLDTTFVTTEQEAWHWIESRRNSDPDFCK